MRIALASILLIGCVSTPPTSTPPPVATSIILSADIGAGASRWEAESATRLIRPIVVVCHGIDEGGVWMMTPDHGPAMPVEGVARLLRTLYPDRPIVLITCNTEGHELSVSGVYYARDLVWSVPGWISPRGVSRITDFVEGY